MKRLILVLGFWGSAMLHVFAETGGAVQPQTEPGPENGGLRLRLSATQRPESNVPGYKVRIDLVNVTQRDILLRAGWTHDDPANVTDYLEAATSIESVPAVAPWIGGVMQGRRTLPQPEQVIKAGETLSVSWQTDQPCLKNRVTNPNDVQNPRFPFPGLYSVHADLSVITDAGTFALRSNEQLVPVGGSRSMPRYTVGNLGSVDGEQKTAILMLGSLHQVAVGDRFEIGNLKGMHWGLTITRVDPQWSLGSLELLTKSKHPPYSNPPTQNMTAQLVIPK
jgi:hypothetical protein